jgi:hypothetical protein
MSDPTETGKVFDVNRSAREYILKKYKWLLIISGIIGLLCILYSILFKDGNFLDFLSVPVLALIIVYTFEIGRFRKQMFENFAKSHGYSFSPSEVSNFGNYSLFAIGKNKSASEIMSGVLENVPVRIFNYSFATESVDSKGRRTDQYHHFFVVDMDFGTVTPSILLRYKGTDIIPKAFGHADVKLEGKLGDIYDLEVEKEFEIEALQIFTPDVMQEMLQVLESPEKPKINIQFSGNHAVIFIGGEINRLDLLENVHSMAADMAKHWGPLMVRLKGDIEALRAQFSAGK